MLIYDVSSECIDKPAGDSAEERRCSEAAGEGACGGSWDDCAWEESESSG